MVQNREPPAYQEYAPSLLADTAFRLMSMESRGLLYTMKLECWVNKKLPSDLEQLSAILGKPITPGMLKTVSQFFKIVGGEIINPELENYRAHLEDRRKKQSEGGKSGAKITNKKRRSRKNPKSTSDSTSSSKVPRQGSDESLVQSSSVNQSQNQLIENDYNYLNGDGTDPLLNDLATSVADVCAGCNGEGCDWCKP